MRFLDEMPPIAAITPQQWALIEHLAALAGPAGQTGNMGTAWRLTGERLVALAEMPGAAIESLAAHLWLLRRDDLIEALVEIDCLEPGTLLQALVTRTIEVEAERDRRAAVLARPPVPRPERTEATARRREAAWQQAQQAPAETLAAVVEALGRTANRQERRRDAARILGLDYVRTPAVDLDAAINDRMAQLAAAGPAAVASTTEATAAPPEHQDPREALLAELQPLRPTTLEAIAAWEASGRQQPWRDAFPRVTDHLGPDAAAAIAHATGARFCRVRDHGDAIRAEHQRMVVMLQEAYTAAEALLADALEAGGWEGLAAVLGVTREAVIECCVSTRSQPPDPLP